MDRVEIIHRLWQLKATAKATNDREALDLAVEALIEPERPKGEWIDKNGWSYCSNCERATMPQNNGCEIEPCRPPFCPWCGVDMRGDEE